MPGAGTRRDFLTTLGLASASVHVAPRRVAAQTSAPHAGSRGLAHVDDFSFASGLTYLQTGSLGPSPRPVIEATIRAWRELELNPAAYGFGAHEQAMDDVRAAAARFLACNTGEVVITSNTTEAMAWVAQGLSLDAGDHVLTTDQEHPGGRVCWDHLARRRGIVIDVVELPHALHDPAGIVRRFRDRLTRQTRVFSFSHVCSATGLRMPVAELTALAHEHGCLAVVDGAQAPGAVAVDVRALGCDAYATSGHKWMLAPKGTGLLYLKRPEADRIQPMALEDGRLAYSASSGVRNLPGILGLGAALDYLAAIGMPRIEAHNLALRRYVFESLSRLPRLRLVSPPDGPLTSPMVAFALPPEVPSPALHRRLRETHAVEVKVVPTQWLNGLRVSTHLFNTERDVDVLVAALTKELA